MSRRIVDCAHVTVEYDTMPDGSDAVLLVPFPATPEGDEQVVLTGSPDDIQGVLDTISSLLDDLEVPS